MSRSYELALAVTPPLVCETITRSPAAAVPIAAKATSAATATKLARMSRFADISVHPERLALGCRAAGRVRGRHAALDLVLAELRAHAQLPPAAGLLRLAGKSPAIRVPR